MSKKPKKVFIFLIAVFILSFFTNLAFGSDEIGYETFRIPVGEDYEIPCAVWYPAVGSGDLVIYDYSNLKREGTAILDASPDTSGGPRPIVVYSHGYSGCSTSSTFLTEVLASSGFIVIAPDHTDDLKACSIEESFKRESFYIFKLLKRAIKISRELSEGKYERGKFRYRFREISAAVDFIIDEGKDPSSVFYGMIDPEKIGAVGHSLGAFSVMAVSGAIETENDTRIGPVVAMSGPGGRVFTSDALKNIGDPAMLMYGSEEEMRANKGWGMDKQYEALSPPKFLMSIDGADHLTFAVDITDKNPNRPKTQKESYRRDLINKYVNAFFELYLFGNEESKKILIEKDEGLKSYEFEF